MDASPPLPSPLPPPPLSHFTQSHSFGVCAAVGRKLIVFEWKRGAYVETQSFSVPEAPKMMAFYGRHICIAYRREYSLLDVQTGRAADLHVPFEDSGSAPPFVRLLPRLKERLIGIGNGAKGSRGATVSHSDGQGSGGAGLGAGSAGGSVGDDEDEDEDETEDPALASEFQLLVSGIQSLGIFINMQAQPSGTTINWTSFPTFAVRHCSVSP